MAPKVFLTGVTGYIGGTAFATIKEAHPDWDFTLLVRNESRADPVKAKYNDVKFVYGTLDDAAVIEKAAAEADLVVHTADSSDNIPAAKAITKGLAAGHSPDKPGYYIHVSGTDILTWYDDDHKRAGEAPLPEQAYNDYTGVDKVINLPDHASHRQIDKIVIGANSPSVRAAIVCPPTIYGAGSGPVNTRSIQVPDMIKATIRDGYAPIVNDGKTEWDNVHVRDLGRLFLLLAEASQDASKAKQEAYFGREAYYFAEAGAHVWGDVARWVSEEVSKQGLVKGCQTKSVSQEEANAKEGPATASWGQNSKGKAERARKLLGWEPKEVSLKETIADSVAYEGSH